MNVFLCWSGERSKKVAEKLEDWLPQIIQAVRPWMSPDIEKGARWGSEIADKLERTKVGIICLAKENLDSRWILFESGALSKTKDARPCTFLLDIVPADVKPPLAQFQHTELKKGDVLKLLQTINSQVKQAGENAISQEVLDNLFKALWPQLEQELLAISQQQPEIEPPMRSESEKLDELLALVRALGRHIEQSAYLGLMEPAEIGFEFMNLGVEIVLVGNYLGRKSLKYTFKKNEDEKILEKVSTEILRELPPGVEGRFRRFAHNLLTGKFPGYSIEWRSLL